MSNYPEQNEGISKARRAVAPYNFVPLPQQPIPAEDAGNAQVTSAEQPTPHLVRHDTYHPERQTGQITATLVAASPLYTRTGLPPEAFARIANTPFHNLADKDKQRYAQFFALNAVPALPGSSLRGMLRTLIEIVAQSKLTRVMQEKPFFRTLTDPATRDIYYDYFLENVGRVQQRPNPSAPCYKTRVHAGFFRRTGTGYTIEACPWGRIDRAGIPRDPDPNKTNLYDGRGPNMTPSWTYQYRSIYVQLESEADHFFAKKFNRHGNPRHPDLYLRFRQVSRASFQAADGLDEGVLVLTGNMQEKHLEFVFLKETTHTYAVADELVARFHDDDQITQWQQKAFPKDRSRTRPRQDTDQVQPEDGKLQDGDPVFFLLDETNPDQVVFFGRAQNFRLPYPHSPRDFVPALLRKPATTDIAEALFGYVPQNDGDRKDQRQPYAGRVFVDDALLEEAQHDTNIWLTDDPQQYIVPKILGGPKPTTFQHYLVQPDEHRRELKHYASTPETEPETVIRGHKLYWHQGHTENWHTHLRHPDTRAGNEGSQNTGLCPVQAGKRFAFSLRFENLSKVELGALLWVLQLASGNEYALKLGMGKPLGMGSVRLEGLQVEVSNRKERYSRLFAENGQWATGNRAWDEGQQQCAVDAFKDYVCTHSGETTSSFEELPRVQMLLHLLRWPGPDASETRYMELDEFRYRPVLPTPADVLGRAIERSEPAAPPHKPAAPAVPADAPEAEPGQQAHSPQRPRLDTDFRFKGQVQAVKAGYYLLELPERVWDRLGVHRRNVDEVRLQRTNEPQKYGVGANTGNCVAVELQNRILYLKFASKKEG